MTDPTTLARGAREKLVSGVRALRSPRLPPELTQADEAMTTALHFLYLIESSRGATANENAPVVIAAVKRALSILKSYRPEQPAVTSAMRAVEEVLSVVHAIGSNAPTRPAMAAVTMPPRLAVQLDSGLTQRLVAVCDELHLDPSQVVAEAVATWLQVRERTKPRTGFCAPG
jgi:hypothetical protein